MTFTEIVNDVMNRLNLTSQDARTRIGIRVNDRYRRVCSSIGLLSSRQVARTVTLIPASIPSLPDYTVVDMQKVNRIIIVDPNGTKVRTLEQVTYDDVTKYTSSQRLPQYWAVKRMGATSTIITFDATPATDPFTIRIDGYDISETLEDDAEPAFPQDFHDILIEGAMADEHRKMEKPELAQIDEANYQTRLGDLRMFIAKAAYLDIYQSKNKPESWYRQGFIRWNIWG